LRSSYSKNFKLSGQKFNSKKPDNLLDDDYMIQKQDLVFELEIAPKVLYLQQVAANGEFLY